MQFIVNPVTDPYFNLASEEYMMENAGDDIFMLWRNDNAVIIGKNQNAFSEVNRGFTEKEGIKVVRRLTGGGAVFHDLGNVNFTFIMPYDGGDLDFSRFTSAVSEVLLEAGIHAEADGRNDIIAGGAKISGNAQCVFESSKYGKRLMHHGTLLFSADLSRMSGALNVSEEKKAAKGIKSVRSRVCNICDIPGYSGPRDAEGFLAFLTEAFAQHFGTARDFSPEEKIGIAELAENKYSRWEWDFGVSREFAASRRKRFSFGTLECGVTTDRGIITDIELSGDFFSTADVSELERRLCGVRYTFEDVVSKLVDCSEYICGSTSDELAGFICGM